MKPTEKEAITNLHRMAFGEAEGPDIAHLAQDLLSLPETISISAERHGRMVGNVLFTPFEFANHPETKCQLLAPLGVLPEYQQSGVGREVMEASITHLKSVGTDAVFVLGVPSYYPQYGFVPTDKQTPYPELLTIPQAWMVLELNAGSVAPLMGKTTAVEPFMRTVLWDTTGHE